MSAAFLLYSHVILTGVAIAAASYHFARLIGEPTPQFYPVPGKKTGLTSAVVLWLLAGPAALLRLGLGGFLSSQRFSLFSLGALIGALLWAFCLGVLVLELLFALFAR